MKKPILFFFIVSFAGWMALSMNSRPENIIMGLFASAITALIFGNMFIRVSFNFKPVSAWWLIAFIGIVIANLAKSAAVSIIRAVAVSSKDIEPQNIEVKTSLKSRLAVTLLSNAVSLSSSMLSVDFNRDSSILSVRYIGSSTGAKDKVEKTVSSYEKALLRFLK